MKKRIRKRRHIGEFAHFGVGIKISANEGNCHDVFDKVVDIAERHEMIVWGGGFGSISIPHMPGNYEIPTLAEKLITQVMLEGGIDGTMLFCAYSVKSPSAPPAFAEEIRSAFAGSEYELEMNEKADIWAKV